MPQFEVGQQDLIDVHHYTIMVDQCAMIPTSDPSLFQRVRHVNQVLVDNTYFSTQKRNNYDKLIPIEDFKKTKNYRKVFINTFLSIEFLEEYVGLGFADINPKEKEINSLTQTVFYSSELMSQQAHRQSYEFEKECINQLAFVY